MFLLQCRPPRYNKPSHSHHTVGCNSHKLFSVISPYLGAVDERGVLAFAAGLTVIRLLPPLVISLPELDTVIAALRTPIAKPILQSAET